MSVEDLMERFGHGRLICLTKHKERTSKILEAVEGMSIGEARELLQACEAMLEQTEINYSVSRSDTTE